MRGVRRSLGIIKAQKRPVKFLISRLLMKSSLNGRLTIDRDGYKLRFHSSSLSASLWVNSKDRSSEEKFLRTLIEPENTLIDIGANIGNISLALAPHCKNILSFEPHPRTFQYLSDNISLNGAQNITPHNLALGREKGELHFSSLSDDSQNCVSTKKTSLSVSVCRLDDIAPAVPIKLIKIDVEGYEGEVLKGAEAVCKRTKYIYLECIEEALNKYGWSEVELVKFLQELNFTLNEVSDTGLKPYNEKSQDTKKMLLAVNESWA
ncbi:MAG: FkbM family methyltransferase [Micavibrio sp.]|nr:FkbM family methyltransferase [Micavibrio sp.]